MELLQLGRPGLWRGRDFFPLSYEDFAYWYVLDTVVQTKEID